MTTQAYLYEQDDLMHAPAGDVFGEVVTDESWPMPAQRKWEPSPKPSLWERFKVWLIGRTEEE
jgi:hypothetical protein